MIESESYILHVSYGEHRTNVSIEKAEFMLWIKNLEKEFKVYHTIEPDENNKNHFHYQYFLLNYYGHLDLIGTSDIFCDYSDLPFV